MTRVRWLRSLLVALPLAALAPASSAPAAPLCDVGVPGCCAVNADCADADLCNGVETCQTGSGTCLAGAAVVCDDLDPCTADACEPATGRCLTPPAADGTPCNDLDACTQTDACAGGTCVGTDPVVCDDGDPCTADACIPATGTCSFPPEEDGVPCDDGDACTTVDVCESGLCTGTQPVDCDDGETCTADVCAPATGACTHPPVADSTPCDDGDACTRTDTCQSGACVGADPIPCDDGLACTSDACVDGVCTFTADDARCASGECFGARCEPGAAGADPTTGCVPVPIREGEVCTDDGASCTDDRCAMGLCIHMAVPERCTADDPCAMAECLPADAAADVDGCVVSPGQPDGATCTEDLDPCTRDRCRAGVCAHEAVENPDACEPVRDPFRQALVLAALARALRDEIAAVPGLLDAHRGALLVRLDHIAERLDAAAADMNGADPQADTARERAILALRSLKRLPRRAKQLARQLAIATKRDPVEPLEALRLGRSADDLRLGVRELKRDVRRLRRALRSFVK